MLLGAMLAFLIVSQTVYFKRNRRVSLVASACELTPTDLVLDQSQSSIFTRLGLADKIADWTESMSHSAHMQVSVSNITFPLHADNA